VRCKFIQNDFTVNSTFTEICVVTHITVSDVKVYTNEKKKLDFKHTVSTYLPLLSHKYLAKHAIPAIS
jgi:hypothetical protein